MKQTSHVLVALAITFGAAQMLGAQNAAPSLNEPAKQLPPVKPLGATFAKSAQLLDAVSAVRQLPGGRLLVNDIAGRKVVLFDSTLSKYAVVADTTSATANAYSSRAGGLVKWKGDSTLFVDPLSLSMLVLNEKGAVSRVMSTPRASDANLLIGGPSGTPGVDAMGRLVYRGTASRAGRGGFVWNGGQGGAQHSHDEGAGTNRSAGNRDAASEKKTEAPLDSAPLLRLDLSARKLDTITMLRVAASNSRMAVDDQGKSKLLITVNPLPEADDWALMADGSVAVLRARDYHIDWIRADGTKESSGKVPFDWKRMSEDEKSAFLDSTKVTLEKLRARVAAGDKSAAADLTGIADLPGFGAAAGGGGGEGDHSHAGGGGGFGGEAGGRGNFGGRGRTESEVQPINMVSASDLSDYVPPFTPGAARGDMEGNLWVRTTRGIDGGSIYDVISPKGLLLKRVLMPPGRVVAGFGKGGVVYTGVREDGRVRLEAAKAP